VIIKNLFRFSNFLYFEEDDWNCVMSDKMIIIHRGDRNCDDEYDMGVNDPDSA